MWLCLRELDMAASHTWICVLLWISTSTQTTVPDTRVTCVFSEECVLPCSFQPDSDEVIHWLKQEVLVHSFQQGMEWTDNQQYIGRTSLFTHLVSNGNASLHLRECGPRDRGRYKCDVRTSVGLHTAHVIVRVEAAIQALYIELSRLSGYEEVKCTTRDVYPAPHVFWATEPPTAESFRPITRKLADQRGLYVVESRLRKVHSQSELTYFCTVNSSYGTLAWTASIREREISGVKGKSLIIPCQAPPYLRNSSLSWSFTHRGKPTRTLVYDNQSHPTFAPWAGRVRVDALSVSLGDGSLHLVKADSQEHTGTYTCVYSAPQKTHTEHIRVKIISAVTGEHVLIQDAPQWWIVAVVIVTLTLALTGILSYLKVRGDQFQAGERPEQSSEMQPVKVGQSGSSESSP